MTPMVQQDLTTGKLVEGSSTGQDKPAASIRRSSSARSLGNSLAAAALGTSTPSLISRRRLVESAVVHVSFWMQVESLNDPWLVLLLLSQYIMELTFTQAAKGVNKEIGLNLEAACQRCDGKGHEPGTKVQHCHHCNGSGMVIPPQQLLFLCKCLVCVCVCVWGDLSCRAAVLFCFTPTGGGRSTVRSLGSARGFCACKRTSFHTSCRYDVNVVLTPCFPVGDGEHGAVCDAFHLPSLRR